MEEETTKLGKFIYNLIDAMFWVADETARWWEISKITIQIKTFRRQKAALNTKSTVGWIIITPRLILL